MKYTDYIPKDAKGITEADHKFVVKHVLPKMGSADKEITNPWSGETATVNPLIGALYTMTYDLSTEANFMGVPLHPALDRWGLTRNNWVQKFDRARYLILKLDSSIYSKFID
jgi:hypothetical protein